MNQPITDTYKQKLKDQIKIVQDMDLGVELMYQVASWMKSNGLNYATWWDPKNMNQDFLLQHSEPNEYFVAIIDNKPVASVILQETERNQSWKSVDGNYPKALYIHWLCVNRNYSGIGLSKKMIEFAEIQGKKRGFEKLRLDTDADEPKLCNLYKSLGFKEMGIENEDGKNTIFFEKLIPH